jgi:hypothetical protein
MSPLSKVFELEPKGLNMPRALITLAVMDGSLIVMEAAGWSVYWVTLALAALFAGASDRATGEVPRHPDRVAAIHTDRFFMRSTPSERES